MVIIGELISLGISSPTNSSLCTFFCLRADTSDDWRGDRCAQKLTVVASVFHKIAGIMTAVSTAITFAGMILLLIVECTLTPKPEP